jgi:hypothetical protein
MNILQEQQVTAAHGQIVHIRRELSKLEDFGWPPQDITQPLRDYDAMRAQLAKNAEAIDELTPANNKAHERQLSELLSKEGYLIESLTSLAGSAAAALAWEESKFFEARETLTQPFKDRAEEADRQAQEAIASLSQALQARWEAMTELAEIQRHLAVISEAHQTTPRIGEPEHRLPKPFAKKPINTFRALVEVYLSRVAEVAANGEAVSPGDLARAVFEK